jgi:hypothetical protein
MPASTVATSGQVVPGLLHAGQDFPDNAARVIALSGAHDLPCKPEKVRVTRNGAEWLAEGCGGRAVYEEKCFKPGEDDPADWTGQEASPPAQTGVICRLKLMLRVPLT